MTGSSAAQALGLLQSGWVRAESGALNPSANTGGLCGAQGFFMSATSGISSANGHAQRRQYLAPGAWGNRDAIQTTRMDAQPLALWKSAVVGGTDLRAFRGYSSVASLTTLLASDDPAILMVGFQYSSLRGDTTWQLVHKTLSGDVLQVIDTTVPVIPVDGAYYFELDVTAAGAQVVGTIYDAAGVVLDQQTITTNLPTPTVPLGPQFGNRVLSGSELVDFWFFEHHLRGKTI